MLFRNVLLPVLMIAFSVPAGAQKKPPRTLPAPPPLMVVDAAGSEVGRFAGVFETIQMVAITVNGALTMAPIGYWPTTAGNVPRGLYWAPNMNTDLFYATPDCSGPPFVTGVRPADAYLGVRRSVVDLDGVSRVLHLGADVEPIPQYAQSRRSWSPHGGYPSGFSSSSCSYQTYQINAVPTETSIVLDNVYPTPMRLK